jgi:predicted nucleic acid-binding protein
MKEYIIDTNALISFVTDRNLEQQEKIASLFEDVARQNATVICPQNVLSEFIYVMEKVYGVSKVSIKTIVSDFIKTPGVAVFHDLDFGVLMKIWGEQIPEYGDAIVASVCKALKGSTIVTFDKRFRSKLKKSGIKNAEF